MSNTKKSYIANDPLLSMDESRLVEYAHNLEESLRVARNSLCAIRRLCEEDYDERDPFNNIRDIAGQATSEEDGK